jgi:hypothetical protein
VLGAVPDWITGNRRVAPFNGETLLRTRLVVPVLLIPFAAAVILAWRRRRGPLLRFGLVLAAALVVSIVAVANTIGVMYEYRLLWAWSLAALVGAVTLAVPWTLGAARFRSLDRFVLPVLLAGLVALSVTQIAGIATADSPRWDAPVVRRVADELARRYAHVDGPILLHSPSSASEWYLQGLLLELEKRGVDARVRGIGGGLYSESRTIGSAGSRADVTVLAIDDFDRLGAPPVPDLVGYAGPRSLGAMERRIARHREVIQALGRRLAAGRISPSEYTERIAATSELPQALAVVAAPIP